jgi:hypothetical protein
MSFGRKRLGRTIRSGVLAAGWIAAIPLAAQTVLVGSEGTPGGAVEIPGARTFVDTGTPANARGAATEATFGWSAASCPAAAKIKFFRPSGADGTRYQLFAERGPFDVPPLGGDPLPNPYPLMTVHVALQPPVALEPRDVVGIAVLTSCGGPNAVASTPPAVVADGDAQEVSTVGSAFLSTSVFVTASGVSESPITTLPLLQNRFVVSLTARDPRTGARATGIPTQITDRSGSFSLPALTGNPRLPELIVKMLDATGAPELGGHYWFFFAPLTDTDVTITVTDQSNGAIRTYSSTAEAGGLSCGSADTSAFEKRLRTP